MPWEFMICRYLRHCITCTGYCQNWWSSALEFIHRRNVYWLFRTDGRMRHRRYRLRGRSSTWVRIWFWLAWNMIKGRPRYSNAVQRASHLDLNGWYSSTVLQKMLEQKNYQVLDRGFTFAVLVMYWVNGMPEISSSTVAHSLSFELPQCGKKYGLMKRTNRDMNRF